MKKYTKYISIVTPAYKTQKVIEKSLLNLKSALDKSKRNYEIICVVDGNIDKTYENALKARNKFKNKIRLYKYDKNMGKGYAVRYGFSKAKGTLVGFIDSDGDIKPESILTLLKTIEDSGADAVVGSKNHPQSNVVYPLRRKIVSAITQLLVRILFNIGVSDTQAGVKLFKRELIERVLPKLKVSRFAFDIELLSLAKKEGFNKLVEAPIIVNTGKTKESTGISTISLNDIFRTLSDMLLLAYELRFGKKYK